LKGFETKMNILKNCPKVLLQKLLFTVLIGVGCLIVGVSYYIFSKDGTALALSCLMLVFSLIRGAGLYDIICGNKYNTVEGACVGIKTKPFGKQCTIKIMDAAGVESSLRLGKQSKFKIGFRYRFYFKQGERITTGSEYFDTALASDNFLGVEELGEFMSQSKEPDTADINNKTESKP
jgi:hypothetical protein